MAKHLLILTQYFPPEVGAPQNRLFELAIRLKAEGLHITVLTAMPNYPQMEIYEGYRNKRYVSEDLQGLKVHRSSIYVSKSKSIVARLRNYFSFVLSSALLSSKLERQYDFLLCESPPLFLGYSAMYLARKKKAKLIFNVSDLWPESAEKLGVVTNKYLLALAYRLEKKLYQRAALVTGQTKGICENITGRFPQVPCYWLPNGVDVSYYNPDKIEAGNWRQKHGFSEHDFIALYAGIIGIAQGLEVILYAAERLKTNNTIKFVLLGSGPCKADLLALKDKLGIHNVFFLDTVSKSEMPGILKSVNTAVVPLRKLDLFKGAIPSKVFESLSMKVPILLGVDGEARQLFVEEGKCALFVEPENAEALAQALTKLSTDEVLYKQLSENASTYVNQKFNRTKIAEGFLAKLQQI